MKAAPNAFTLIELLVVIAIMALIGVIALANYKSFGEDQNLKSTVLDIQSLLRAAQTGATANQKCNTEYSATWQVEVVSLTTVNLKCQEPSALITTKKTLQFDSGIAITSITGSGPDCPWEDTLPFVISFAPLSGDMYLGGTDCTLLRIFLRNDKTSASKSVRIEKGGRIYGQ